MALLKPKETDFFWLLKNYKFTSKGGEKTYKPFLDVCPLPF